MSIDSYNYMLQYSINAENLINVCRLISYPTDTIQVNIITVPSTEFMSGLNSKLLLSNSSYTTTLINSAIAIATYLQNMPPPPPS